MSYLTSFLISFCVSAIFIGAIFIICPSGKMSNPIKYILSLIFSLVIISSASEISIDFTLADIFKTTEISSSQKLEANSAEYVLGQVLKGADIKFREISVYTTKSTDGSIIISKVIIYSAESREKILNALADFENIYEVEIKNE